MFMVDRRRRECQVAVRHVEPRPCRRPTGGRLTTAAGGHRKVKKRDKPARARVFHLDLLE